jgi:MFS family permease
MKIGYRGPNGAPVITNALRQGGIVAIYYLGTLCSAFVGGWFCDRYGRIKTIALGAAWAIFGACFQCSAMNPTWMIFARLLTGFGTGLLNVVVPIWSTETAEHTSRGLFVSIEFTLNIFGVVVAYWLEYGCSFYGGGDSSFVWRFPIAFQIVPLIVLISICGFFPESPRWLAKMGRMDEARYVLERLRGETEAGRAQAEKEFSDIIRLAELEEKDNSQNSYWFMLTDFKSKLHLGRRVQLVIWLQIVQEWVGIAGVSVSDCHL